MRKPVNEKKDKVNEESKRDTKKTKSNNKPKADPSDNQVLVKKGKGKGTKPKKQTKGNESTPQVKKKTP